MKANSCSPMFLTALCLVVFWISAIQISSVQWFLTTVLICNSLMTYDVEQLFMFIWHLYIFFGIWIFCPFLMGFFTALLLSFANFFMYFGHRTYKDKCFTNIFSKSVAYIFAVLYKHIFRQTKSQEINLPCTFPYKVIRGYASSKWENSEGRNVELKKQVQHKK